MPSPATSANSPSEERRYPSPPDVPASPSRRARRGPHRPVRLTGRLRCHEVRCHARRWRQPALRRQDPVRAALHDAPLTRRVPTTSRCRPAATPWRLRRSERAPSPAVAAPSPRIAVLLVSLRAATVTHRTARSRCPSSASLLGLTWQTCRRAVGRRPRREPRFPAAGRRWWTRRSSSGKRNAT